MSQSNSPESFYATLDALLEADTGDLRELAKIAGVPPEELYSRADLSGTDLTRQDVGFLLNLNVNYEGARLLQSQKKAFETAQKKNEQRERILRERIKLVVNFVDHYRKIGPAIFEDGGGKPLDADFLASIMVTPLQNLEMDFERPLVKSAYLANILDGLSPWTRSESFDFFNSLFATMGALGAEPSPKSLERLSVSYLPSFGSRLGKLLSQLSANEQIDRWFVFDAASDEQRLLFSSCLSSKRALHSKVVVAVMQNLNELGDMITFLEQTRIEVDDNTAEEISYMLSRLHWSQNETETILQAKLPRIIFRALTRQIMKHKDQSRLESLIAWRDADRGAAGGLSLDELFRAFKSFNNAIRAAESIAINLAPSQIAAMTDVLFEFASNSEDRARVKRLIPNQTLPPGRREPQITTRTPGFDKLL